jgi:hypothetical protein
MSPYNAAMFGKLDRWILAYLAYFVAVVGLALYPLFTLRGDALYAAFDEYRWIEDVQWAHIAAALIAQIVVLVRGENRGRESRLIDWMGMLLVGSMLLRELNNYWETAGLQTEYRIIGYGTLASLLVLGLLLILERRRHGTRILAGPPQHWIKMYLCGLVGYLLANAVARVVKDLGTERIYWRVLEEGAELAVGTLFLFGAIEALRAVAAARREGKEAA